MKKRLRLSWWSALFLTLSTLLSLQQYKYGYHNARPLPLSDGKITIVAKREGWLWDTRDSLVFYGKDGNPIRAYLLEGEVWNYCATNGKLYVLGYVGLTDENFLAIADEKTYTVVERFRSRGVKRLFCFERSVVYPDGVWNIESQERVFQIPEDEELNSAVSQGGVVYFSTVGRETGHLWKFGKERVEKELTGVFLDLSLWHDEIYCVEVLNWGLPNFSYIVRRLKVERDDLKIEKVYNCGEGNYCRLESFYPGGLYLRIGKVAPNPDEEFFLISWDGKKKRADGRYYRLKSIYLKLTYDGEKYDLWVWNGRRFVNVYTSSHYLSDFVEGDSGKIYFTEYEDEKTEDSVVIRIEAGGM